MPETHLHRPRPGLHPVRDVADAVAIDSLVCIAARLPLPVFLRNPAREVGLSDPDAWPELAANPAAGGARATPVPVHAGRSVLYNRHELERSQTDRVRRCGIRPEGRGVLAHRRPADTRGTDL